MKKNYFLLIILSLFVTFSCKDDKKTELDKNHQILEVQNFVDYLMGDLYLWNDKINWVEKKNYDNIFAYFNDILYVKDNMSFSMSGDDFKYQLEGIENRNYGVQYMQPIKFFKDYSIKVAYVYPNSPFGKKGVKRGWTLTHIDGYTVSTLIQNQTLNEKLVSDNSEFTFLDLNGSKVIIKDKKSVFNVNSVLRSEVITSSDFAGLPCNVGYFNYLSFDINANMLEEVTREFTKLKEGNVEELILDLRYNGGGDDRAIEHLANLISPLSSQGKVFLKTKFNQKNSSENKDNFSINRNALSLDLKRIFILTSKYTASASEVMINGLKPFMDVQLVGETTFGKPYGMFLIPYPYTDSDSDYENAEYVFYPICMRSYNYNDDTFEGGFLPTNLRYDDLYHDFGVEEDFVNACLSKITNGVYPTQIKSKTKSSTPVLERGFEMKKEYEKAGYGVLISR